MDHFVNLHYILSHTILDKILAKYGKETIYSADCAPLADKIGLSETTVKRMFGVVGKTLPSVTKDLTTAPWTSYRRRLDAGTQIQIRLNR